MTVGYFAPMPPARTGVADYAAALHGALSHHRKLRVNGSGDVNLYQLGNNQLHRPIYERAIRTPGVVLLHDAVLHHFYLGALTREKYIDEFAYNYGDWSREHSAQLYDGRARSAADPEYFRYPMLKRIAETSKAVIVHNAAAARIVREHAPSAVIHEIPHLYEPAVHFDAQDSLRLRSSMGVRPGAMLFGVFGHLRESKRLHAVMRAFRSVCDSTDAYLLVAGEFVSSDLSRALEHDLQHPRVLRVGYLPDQEFCRYAHAIDVCINLRYPSVAESSGIAIRMMGLGKPVIVTDGQEIQRLPDAACLRVPSGLQEEPVLREYMIWLNCFRADAREIGHRAASYIEAHHNLDTVATQFEAVLDRAA